MKLFLVFVSLVCAVALTSQVNAEDNPLWQNSGPGVLTAESTQLVGPEDETTEEPMAAPIVMAMSVGEEVAAEITALAAALDNDPLKIFNYVRNQIRYEHYYGLKKGAVLTLLEGSGNDFDQCVLLAGLLTAAAAADDSLSLEIQYRRGRHRMSLAEGNGINALDYLGLSHDPHPGKTYEEVYGPRPDGWETITDVQARQMMSTLRFLSSRGTPSAQSWTDIKSLVFFRTWLRATINGSVYELDPSFKLEETIEGIDLLELVGYDREALLTFVGGTQGQGFVQKNNSSDIGMYLGDLNHSIVNLLTEDYQGYTLAEIIRGRRIAKETINSLNDAYPLKKVFSNRLNETDVTSTLNNYKVKVRFQTGSLNYLINTADLNGRKISLTFNGNTVQLRLDDVIPSDQSPTANISAASFKLKITVTHPGGLIDPHSENKDYKKNNSFSYAILYGFSPSGRLLQKRYEQLSAYLDAGKADTSMEVQTELLNIMGLTWLYQTQLANEMLAEQNGVNHVARHRFGRMAQEEGFYIDVGLQFSGDYPRDSVFDDGRFDNVFHLGSLFASAMEHGIIEQMQPNMTAVSTVNLIRRAYTDGQPVYLADSTNWSHVKNQLSNYLDPQKADFETKILTDGARIFLPKSNGITQGQWTGSGWVVRSPNQAGMIINGGFNGGWPTQKGIVSSPRISTGSAYNPVYKSLPSSFPSAKLYTPPSYTTPKMWGSDPVDMATGAFTYAQEDLETGIFPAPSGLSFSRSYTSKNSAQDQQNMGYGWTHNLHIRAAKRSATEEALGLGTPQQAATFLTASLVASDLYQRNASPKEWMTAVLAVAWFQDQMKENAVSITIGDNTFQFIKQPDGTFLPPAGSTMSLSIVQNGYVLKQRHGNTIYFGYSLKNVTDPQIAYFIDDTDGKRMSFHYHADDRLDQVIDASRHRAYIFSYNGSRIIRITEYNDNRFVEFTYDAHGNLTSVKDPEGKSFFYDYEVIGDPAGTEAKDHRIVRLRDHDGGIITQNVYDELGRVVEQYLHGDPQKTWKLSYTGTESYEVNPEGGITTYLYDERGRSAGKIDADGNYSFWEYDAQDRVVRKTSAEGETLVNTYDSNHNLLRVDLPRGGGSVFYQYDNLNRLTSIIDPEGDETVYTYFDTGFNAGKNRPRQIIDPEGATTFTYYASGIASGNVHTITDADGLVIENAYDNKYGQPISTKAPGGFLTQYQYSPRGDLLLLTDPNGVKTAYTYNKRRQVTQEISDQGGSNQAITDYAYDNTGNPLSETAPADNNNQRVTTRFTYTPTEKLKAAFLSNGTGEDRIVEHDYDGRDLEIASTDAKGRVTTLEYFANNTLASAIQPLGRASSFLYDADERLISQTSPGSSASRTSGFEYLVSDAAEGDQSTGYPMTVFTDADSESVFSEYDRNENLRFYTNKNGGVFEMRYDGLGRLTHVITPSGKTHQSAYNHRGEVTQITEPSGDTTTFSYNATTGRLVTATFSGPNGDSTVSVDAYDNNGNILEVSEGNLSVQRTYDSQNRVSSYTDANGKQIQYRYYPSGKLAKLIYPGGSESGIGHVEYTYWATGRLKDVIDCLSSATTPRISTYYWDEAGYLTRIVRPNGTERQITYDAAGRPELVREVAANGSLIKLYKNNYFPSDQLQWTYQLPYAQARQELPAAPVDPSYPRKFRETQYGPVIPSPVASMTYNADNQLVLFEGQSVLHDLDGNMTLGPLPDGQMGVFSYNSRNSLLAAGGMSYTYDPEGERIAAAGNGDSISYVNEVNLGLSQVLERTKNGETTTYVWGVGLLYEVDENGEAVYYHYDNVGSTIALTNDAGAVMERIEYAPYGSIVHRARESGFEGDLHDTPYLFTGFYGCQTDSNGLIYLRERYYNTLTRRFINPDPAREGWNWYAYAGGDPMGFVDPTGLGQMRTLDILQKTLAVLGMVPGVGEIFDVVNAGISFARGNYSDAAIHLASAIPGIGNAVAGAKMAGGLASASMMAVRMQKSSTSLARQATRTGAEGWGAGIAMRSKLSALENAQQTAAKTRVLFDGRIRYYGAEVSARTPGATRGASYVTEWNSGTGSVRSWMESYDHFGRVNRIHPKMINGQGVNLPHYPPIGRELGR